MWYDNTQMNPNPALFVTGNENIFIWNDNNGGTGSITSTLQGRLPGRMGYKLEAAGPPHTDADPAFSDEPIWYVTSRIGCQGYARLIPQAWRAQ
jgi:hypothetical protein